MKNVLDSIVAEKISDEEWNEYINVGKGENCKEIYEIDDIDDFNNIDEKDEPFKSTWKIKEEEQGEHGEKYIHEKVIPYCSELLKNCLKYTEVVENEISIE